MKRQLLFSTLISTMMTCALAASPGRTMPPVAVKTEIVTPFQWQQKVAMTGKLKASQGIVVKAEASGRVTKLLFHSGESVQSGTQLVQLNDQSLQAQKKIALLELALSQKDLQRKSDLYTKHAISKADFDNAASKVKADEAKLEQINAELDQLTIKAPFSGKLGLRQISVGDYLTPGQSIVNLQATTPILVNFDAPDTIISQIKVGQEIQVRSPSNPNRLFQGKVCAIESLVDPGSQSLTVQAVLNNPNNQLIPGTFVGVTLLLGSKQQVLMVPQTAVIYAADGNYIYTSDGKVAHKSKVTLGERTANKVIIKEGLTNGQSIVTIGNLKLYDGANILTNNQGVQQG